MITMKERDYLRSLQDKVIALLRKRGYENKEYLKMDTIKTDNYKISYLCKDNIVINDKETGKTLLLWPIDRIIKACKAMGCIELFIEHNRFKGDDKT